MSCVCELLLFEKYARLAVFSHAVAFFIIATLSSKSVMDFCTSEYQRTPLDKRFLLWCNLGNVLRHFQVPRISLGSMSEPSTSLTWRHHSRCTCCRIYLSTVHWRTKKVIDYALTTVKPSASSLTLVFWGSFSWKHVYLSLHSQRVQ